MNRGSLGGQLFCLALGALLAALALGFFFSDPSKEILTTTIGGIRVAVTVQDENARLGQLVLGAFFALGALTYGVMANLVVEKRKSRREVQDLCAYILEVDRRPASPPT